MRTSLLAAPLLAAVLLATAFCWADDKPLDPGLKPGKDEIGGPFEAYVVGGPHYTKLNKDRQKQDKQPLGVFHCPVSEYGLNPVVAVFVRGTQPSEQVKALLEKLDQVVAKNEKNSLNGFVVFLAEDAKDLLTEDVKREDAAAVIQAATKNFTRLEVGIDTAADVKDAFKLNDEAEVTVLLYWRYRVLSNRAFRKDGLDDAAQQAVVDEIKARLTAIRADLDAGKSLPKK